MTELERLQCRIEVQEGWLQLYRQSWEELNKTVGRILIFNVILACEFMFIFARLADWV